MTGDNEYCRIKTVQKADIIPTMPEIALGYEGASKYLTAEIIQLTAPEIVKKGMPGDHIERHMREPGRLMNKYYLKFDTMKHTVKAQYSLEEVLHTVCKSEELSWIQLRRNEKRVLNDINTDKDGQGFVFKFLVD